MPTHYYLIDASKYPLGRLATRISVLLRGKNSVDFKPNVFADNIVIVINASGIKLTGNKVSSKIYTRYTGFHGGIKNVSFSTLRKKNPQKIIREAVRGMLPKNRLTSKWLKNLKVYASGDHSFKKEKLLVIKE